MVRVNVDRETALAIRSTNEVVQIFDDRGECLGYMMPPLSKEERAIVRERLESDGPWYTTEEVLAHLQTLES
jgi:hypothetical protein